MSSMWAISSEDLKTKVSFPSNVDLFYLADVDLFFPACVSNGA